MKKELTMKDICSNHGDYKTIFAIETGTERKFVHFLGYCYYVGEPKEKPYRFVEYCWHYIPLEEALSKGLYAAEMENVDDIKQYISDVDSVLDIYKQYDNGKPVQILQSFENVQDGIYILEND